MDKKLPNKWVLGNMYDILQPVNTGVTEYAGDKFYYSTGSISAKEYTPEGVYTYDKRPSRANREVKLGDVLQARMQGTDKAVLTNNKLKEALFSTGFMQFRPYGETVVSKFIFYYTNSHEFNRQKDELASGTTQVAINDANAKKLLFPLPPLPEQKRIVAKLDGLFAHLEELKTRLDKIPELLKDFRQSVLSKAVSGELAGIIELKQLSDFEIDIKTGPFGSALHKSDYINDGIPVINPSHIKAGNILPNFNVSIDNKKAKELSRWFLNNNDVILGRRGEMGRAAKYQSAFGPMICGTGSLVLKCSESVSPDFLTYYLRSPFCVSFLKQNSVGSTMVNLNQKILNSLPFPNLTLDQQKKSIERVESAFLKAKIIEEKYNSLKQRIDNLPQAILAKTFRGELVEQLSTDGDARDLLKEIEKLKEEGKKK
jgi:type I restriction enzyme S subunit